MHQDYIHPLLYRFPPLYLILLNYLGPFYIHLILYPQYYLLTQDKTDYKIFVSSRYDTKNTHGTGCTLSSAITTFFSCGKPIKKACELGIKYVNSAILTNPKFGKGHGPINHLNSMEIKKEFK